MAGLGRVPPAEAKVDQMLRRIRWRLRAHFDSFPHCSQCPVLE
jgi:hypothetical protein